MTVKIEAVTIVITLKYFISICVSLYLAAKLLGGCAPYRPALETTQCKSHLEIQDKFSRSEEMKDALGELVNSGVPGAAVALYSEEEGWWAGAAGYARIEDKVPMQNCHLQYLQSISKTYMAVVILKLYEQQKIELDVPIARYLPEEFSRKITGTDRITVRMLLNHTSGLPEYNYDPAYVTYLLQHPNYKFKPTEYLKYIAGEPLDFEPSSRYSYRNSNYLVLALLVDAVIGDHARYMSEVIFKPLGLSNTYYRNDPGYLAYPQLVNTYWDRYSNGIVENVSQLQGNNVASLIGDDGIVTTPFEAVTFLRALLEGKLLEDSTLSEMKAWVKDDTGEPRYGLGLGRTRILDQLAIGHSGGGIGAGVELYYFPDKKTYFFIAINLGTVTDSPMHIKAADARNRLYEVLLE